MKYTNIVSKLDKAADKMRGKGVKSTDYYNVILSIVFIKFMTSKMEKIYKDNNFSSFEEFLEKGEFEPTWIIIEPEYFWSKIKIKNVSEIKQSIDKAYSSIESNNNDLKNLSIYNFSSSDITGPTVINLIEIIENLPEYNESEYIDIFGEIYEYFIGKYSSEAKRGGEFYTPHSLVKLMTHIVENNINKDKSITVYDPTCGSGGMLNQSLAFLKQKGVENKKIHLYGQELLGETWKIAKMNLSIRDVSFNLGIKNDDTFSNDLFYNEKFDFILSNPPFNQEFSKSEYGFLEKEKDRFKYGFVWGSGRSNYMFFQHVIHHLNDNGIGAVVMHAGAGSDNAEKEIRKNMIEDNIIESIILLPGGIFKNTQIPTTVWLFNKNKKSNDIIFINLQDKTIKIGNSRNYWRYNN